MSAAGCANKQADERIAQYCIRLFLSHLTHRVLHSEPHCRTRTEKNSEKGFVHWSKRTNHPSQDCQMKGVRVMRASLAREMGVRCQNWKRVSVVRAGKKVSDVWTRNGF